jgi:hypothetical protein
MTLGDHGALLGDLALEQVGLGTLRRERRVGLGHDGRAGSERARFVVRQHGEQERPAAGLRGAEEGDQATTPCDRVDHGVAEVADRLARDRRERHRAPIAQLLVVQSAHGTTPPSDAVALASTSRRPTGR